MRGLLVAAMCIAPTIAWPQGKIVTVGVLSTFSPADYAGHLDQLRKGMRDLGYVEGRNLKMEVRHADGKIERLPQLAAELAAVPVDVLVTAGSHVTRVARKATRNVPIVMAYAGDPVGGGPPQLAGKRLEILREILPKVDNVAVFWNPDVPERVIQFQETQTAAKSLRLIVHSFEVRLAAEIEPALEALAAKRPDAMIVLSDALLEANLRTIAAFALRHRLAAIHQSASGPQLGMLLSYGANHPAMHYRAATYVDKIVKGAKPADLPIEQPTQFELIVNLKTAKTLGIRIPQSVLARADAIIQ